MVSSIFKDSLRNSIPSSFFLPYAFFIIIASLSIRVFFLASSDLLVEEAYYWNYAQHLDFSYLDHPPMVAYLIHFTTLLFGFSEFGVRIGTLFCWLLTAFFSYKLTETIQKGMGWYAVMLISILPFFFIDSLIITPDQPLNTCWAASLYCLFQALVRQQSRYWYGAGVSIGLGMLSKYAIVLLGPCVLLYLLIVPSARQWFLRKEPYICLLISLLLFSPVLYWNAQHHWVSFIFQTSRRMDATQVFTFHQFLGLLVFFLMPFGIVGFIRLFKPKTNIVSQNTRTFLQIFTLVPLAVFGLFSLTHAVKFNWIGPGLLAIIPWLAIQIGSLPQVFVKRPLNWINTTLILLLCYSFLIFIISYGNVKLFNQVLLPKFLSWQNLTLKVNEIAQQVESETHNTPIIIPLDVYHISSGLSYYQAKLLAQGKTNKSYPVEGRHLLGGNSLMYRYWSKHPDLSGKWLILISKNPNDFEGSAVKERTLLSPTFRGLSLKESDVQTISAHNQGGKIQVGTYYFRVVRGG